MTKLFQLFVYYPYCYHQRCARYSEVFTSELRENTEALFSRYYIYSEMFSMSIIVLTSL